MSKKISEDDIKQYINDIYPDMSLPNIYFLLKKQVQEQNNVENFNSIVSNYTPIFLYYAIKRKCSLSDFTKILQLSQNYEDGINRFFNRADCNYWECETSHIYNKMSFLFYKADGEHIIFDEEKIPYIKELIKNVRVQNLLDFHSSRIDSFLAHIINKDVKFGKEILETLVSSPFMWKEEHRKYPNMIQSLIDIFAHENYSKDIAHIYNLFKHNTVVYNEIKKNIISLSLDTKEKYKINLSIYKMILDNEENYFDLVETRLQELKQKLSTKEYVGLISDSIYAFETGIDKKPVLLNIEKIKPSNQIIDNIPYLSILQKLIKSNQHSYIIGKNDYLTQYIKMQKEQADKNYQDKIITISECILIEDIDYDLIEKFFNYIKFNNKYIEKDTKTVKNKL